MSGAAARRASPRTPRTLSLGIAISLCWTIGLPVLAAAIGMPALAAFFKVSTGPSFSVLDVFLFACGIALCAGAVFLRKRGRLGGLLALGAGGTLFAAHLFVAVASTYRPMDELFLVTVGGLLVTTGLSWRELH